MTPLVRVLTDVIAYLHQETFKSLANTVCYALQVIAQANLDHVLEDFLRIFVYAV